MEVVAFLTHTPELLILAPSPHQRHLYEEQMVCQIWENYHWWTRYTVDKQVHSLLMVIWPIDPMTGRLLLVVTCWNTRLAALYFLIQP